MYLCERSEAVVLVIGGSKGLGKAISDSLSNQGLRVIVNSRGSSPVRESKSIKHIVKDISSFDDAQEVVKRAHDFFGRVDTLIYCVGPFIRERKLFCDYSLSEIENTVSGNLLGPMWVTKLILPSMRERNFGRIIYFGFGRVCEAPSWPQRSVYAASKTGLASFTKTLAAEEAQFGITVNMISPSDIVGVNKEKAIREVEVLIDKESPIGRPGCGEDVFRIVNFLLEKDSSFITGSIINATGGLDVIRPNLN